MGGRDVGIPQGLQVTECLFPQPILVGTGRKGVQERGDAAGGIVDREIRRCHYGDLRTSFAEYLSQDSDQIAVVLSGCGHKDVVFKEVEKLRRERPRGDNLLAKMRLVGLSAIGE